MRRLINKIIHAEAFGGGLILISAILAIIIKNSGLKNFYDSILGYHFTLGSKDYYLSKPMILWINDGLMAIFFLVVALEIKREIFEGNLSSRKKLTLPLFGALGGIVAPAMVYLMFNYHDPYMLKGWAIPAATDIAFALGVLAILGKRIPVELKICLLAIAIIDDLIAILIIAFFYTENISLMMILGATIVFSYLFILNYLKIEKLIPYVLGGLVMWLLVLKSGIHATIAGVILGFVIPIKSKDASYSPLKFLENKLHPYVVFVILPVFAFANAGVDVMNFSMEYLMHSVTLGIAFGLFIGKQVGVFCLIWVLAKLRIVDIPQNVSFKQLYGMSLLTGIGFTMSLFIGNLAFGESIVQENVKIGVLLGSTCSAILGLVTLWLVSKQPGNDTFEPKQAL